MPRSHPSRRRFVTMRTPNISDMPRKCSVSHAGHTYGWWSAYSLIPAAEKNAPPGSPNSLSYCPPTISGWRISPPRFAARETAAIDSTVRTTRSEEHTSELQSRLHLVCRLLLEKKNNTQQLTFNNTYTTSTS